MRKTSRPDPEHLITSAIVHDLRDAPYSSLLKNALQFPQSRLAEAGWRFENDQLTRLFEKLKATGKPLRELYGSPLYGIKTGLNDAFVVSNDVKEQLVTKDSHSTEILKPFLEGKDLKPWQQQWRGLWLINAQRGIDIERYPAIKHHLQTYRVQLEERVRPANRIRGMNCNNRKRTIQPPIPNRRFSFRTSIDFQVFQSTHGAFSATTRRTAFKRTITFYWPC